MLKTNANIIIKFTYVNERAGTLESEHWLMTGLIETLAQNLQGLQCKG